MSTTITRQMLQNLAAPKDIQSDGFKLSVALQCLDKSAKLLGKHGLTKQAEEITVLFETLAEKI